MILTIALIILIIAVIAVMAHLDKSASAGMMGYEEMQWVTDKISEYHEEMARRPHIGGRFYVGGIPPQCKEFNPSTMCMEEAK